MELNGCMQRRVKKTIPDSKVAETIKVSATLESAESKVKGTRNQN